MYSRAIKRKGKILGCDSCPYSIILNLMSEKKRQLSNVQGGRGLNTREPRKFSLKRKKLVKQHQNALATIAPNEKYRKILITLGITEYTNESAMRKTPN